MTNDREKTITFGAFDGREEYEANQRRKIVSLLNHFRTNGDVEKFLAGVEELLRDWAEYGPDLKGMVESQDHRSYLLRTVTSFLKWAAGAVAGIAALKVVWEFIKSSLGGGT